MPLPLTISCSSKSRLVLPFWYRLIQVVPSKGPLNGCSSLLMKEFQNSLPSCRQHQNSDECRIRGKIVRTVLCRIIYYSSAQQYMSIEQFLRELGLLFVCFIFCSFVFVFFTFVVLYVVSSARDWLERRMSWKWPVLYQVLLLIEHFKLVSQFWKVSAFGKVTCNSVVAIFLTEWPVAQFYAHPCILSNTSVFEGSFLDNWQCTITR